MVACAVCSWTESTLSSLCQLWREESREPFTPTESGSLNKGSQDTWFAQHSTEGGGKKGTSHTANQQTHLVPSRISHPAPFLPFQCQAAHMGHINLLLCSRVLLPPPLHTPLPSHPHLHTSCKAE